jgi:hypothetical protein
LVFKETGEMQETIFPFFGYLRRPSVLNNDKILSNTLISMIIPTNPLPFPKKRRSSQTIQPTQAKAFPLRRKYSQPLLFPTADQTHM